MKISSNRRLTLPNILTIARMVLIIALVPCFFDQSDVSRLLAFGIFFIACITDYLDGYLARLWNQSTRFGQLFDPVADKMLIATTLLLMAAFNFFSKFSLIPALIILCREIFVSGLREFMSTKHLKLPVTRLAKYKTAFQMLSIGLLLMADIFSYQTTIKLFGELFLWVAAILTIATGYQYFKQTINHV